MVTFGCGSNWSGPERASSVLSTQLSVALLGPAGLACSPAFLAFVAFPNQPDTQEVVLWAPSLLQLKSIRAWPISSLSRVKCSSTDTGSIQSPERHFLPTILPQERGSLLSPRATGRT